MDICTAEQKIAYNIAFRLHVSYQDKYNALDSEFTKSDAVRKMVERGMKNYRMAYGYRKDCYNEDAIFAALGAGLKNYLDGKSHIKGSYEEIGKAFPAHYKEVKPCCM